MIIEELWQRNKLADHVAVGDVISWNDPEGSSTGIGSVIGMLPYSQKPKTVYGKHVYVTVDSTSEHVPLSWVIEWNTEN